MMGKLSGKSKIQLVLLTGIIFDLNCAHVMAANYTAPIDSNQPITLNNGDTLTYSTTGNTNVIGVNSTSGGSLNVTGSANINITNNPSSNDNAKAAGVRLINSNQNTLGTGSYISVIGNKSVDTVSETETVNALYVLGSGTSVSADSLTLNATNNNSSGAAIGVRAQGGSSVTLTGNNTINVKAGAASGTGAASGLKAANPKNQTPAPGTYNNIVVEQVTINAENGIGAYADAYGSIDLGKGSNIKTTGDNSNGVVAMNLGASLIGTHLSVETKGKVSAAVLARAGGTVFIGEGSSVITTNSYGVYANSGAYGASSSLASRLDYKGTATERNRIEVVVNDPTINISAVYAQGAGATINLDNTDIVAKDTNGMRADTNGALLTSNNTTIDVITTDSSAYGVYANTGGKVDLTGDTTINVYHDSSYPPINDIGSALFANDAIIYVDGKINITGNIDAFQSNGLININATKGSVFTGEALAESGGAINLIMTDGVWNMRSAVTNPNTVITQSVVTNLELNNSVVNFYNLNNSNNSAEPFRQLTTNTLSGDATFNMHTDIVGQAGDLLVVNGAVSGTHKINVKNYGSAATSGKETLTIVKTDTVNTPINNFALVNKVELGAYEYGLREVAGSPNNLELYSSGEAGKLTTTAEAAGSFLNIGYLTNYIENQTLLQRLGDLHNNEYGTARQDGFWMKGFGGKLNSFAGYSLKGFDMTYTGTQFGIDKSFDVDNGRLLVGAMAGFTYTNPNYHKGDGTGKNYTAGFYTTYLLDNGFYVDNVLKFNRMRNQFNVKDTGGSSVKGRAKTHGVSFSTEIGKRFWLESKNQGFYIEPQAQLSYGYQTGDTVKASNGLRVGLSHYNSTLGRIGGIVGYQTQGDTPVSVYLKTGVVREMSGGASYRFNDGDKKGHSFRSNWFDNGIGVDVNINKKHNIYAEADYATGNQFDNAKLNIGYRYSF